MAGMKAAKKGAHDKAKLVICHPISVDWRTL
jgi:hypothetical protein